MLTNNTWAKYEYAYDYNRLQQLVDHGVLLENPLDNSLLKTVYLDVRHGQICIEWVQEKVKGNHFIATGDFTLNALMTFVDGDKWSHYVEDLHGEFINFCGKWCWWASAENCWKVANSQTQVFVPRGPDQHPKMQEGEFGWEDLPKFKDMLLEYQSTHLIWKPLHASVEFDILKAVKKFRLAPPKPIWVNGREVPAPVKELSNKVEKIYIVRPDLVSGYSHTTVTTITDTHLEHLLKSGLVHLSSVNVLKHVNALRGVE